MMNTLNPNISIPAALIGEPTRAAILMALCDGRAHAAGALADSVNISPQSASNHLGQLVEGGLLIAIRQGRHRYYRLASLEVAHSIEALAAIAAPISRDRLIASKSCRELVLARCCYRHLAGALGVALLNALKHKAFIATCGKTESGVAIFNLTDCGRHWIAASGIVLNEHGNGICQKAFARSCIDWTERREHLAGTLGNRLMQHFEAQGFLALGAHKRARHVTEIGEKYFDKTFGIELPSLRASANLQTSGLEHLAGV